MEKYEQKRKPFEPTEEWLAEYERQADERLIGRARRYAKSRARSIAKVGGRGADDDYVRELVQEALVSTFTGDLRWDPEEKTLEAHVLDVVRFRTKNDLARALHLPHVVLDGERVSETGEYDTIEGEVSEALARSTPQSSPELRIVVVETLAALRALAGDDPRVLPIVGAIEQGATTRDDVLALTDLTPEDYHTGRVRLTALVQQLPDSLRRAARGMK